MNCKCRHCGEDYENDRDYKTSICNECFKAFNENNVQPLKDALQSAYVEIRQLRSQIEELTK